MSLEISEPRPDDFAAMAKLCQAHGGPMAQATPQSLAKLCHSANGLALVAREQGKVMGMLIYASGDHGNHVQSLLVDPAYQGDDLQHILVARVIDKLRTRGVHTFQLTQQSQGDKDFWDNAKWQGNCDLAGCIPVGRQQTCAIA